MISQGFRTYDIEADDFPIKFTASTEASKLPEIAPVTFLFQDVATGAISRKKRTFIIDGAKVASLVLEAPDVPCNIVFSLVVRFPAANPADKPLRLLIVSDDDQKAKDDISPEEMPIVFANYVMRFR